MSPPAHNTYTGEHFTITCDSAGDSDGFKLSTDYSATISANNGEIITKVEFARGWGATEALHSQTGTVAYNHPVATVSGVNATSLTVDVYNVVQIKAVTVYYTAAAPAHTHAFTYSADGATIMAECGAEGCDLTSNPTLTITAPTLTTYGQTGDGISEAATLDGMDDFNSATGLSVSADFISYYKATKSGTTYTKSDALASAPTDAGDYLAEITLSGVKTGAETTGDVTASVGYTIAKVETTITTAPTAGKITYGQTLADSTLTGGEGSVAGSFAWKDSAVAPAVSDSQTTEYDVVFTPTDANYSTAECKVKLTVNKANSSVTKAPKAKVLKYNGTSSS